MPQQPGVNSKSRPAGVFQRNKPLAHLPKYAPGDEPEGAGPVRRVRIEPPVFTRCKMRHGAGPFWSDEHGNLYADRELTDPVGKVTGKPG